MATMILINGKRLYIEKKFMGVLKQNLKTLENGVGSCENCTIEIAVVTKPILGTYSPYIEEQGKLLVCTGGTEFAPFFFFFVICFFFTWL